MWNRRICQYWVRIVPTTIEPLTRAKFVTKQVLRSLAPSISISSATMSIMWLDKMVVTDTYSSDVIPGNMSLPVRN